jgi:uncharacterized protein YecA (UPF0149 family)
MLRKLQNERHKQEEKAKNSIASEELASNCKNEETPAKTAGLTPRNAHCPCNSGLKFKRCCGRTAAPVLSQAA